MAGETVFLQGEPSRVRGLAVNQWSMQTFMTEGVWTDLGCVVSDLQIVGDELSGSVRNDTDRTLTDAVIILGNRITRLGDVSPGQGVPVTVSLSDLSNERLGSVGWRLFQEYFDQPGPAGPPREVQLKQAVVDTVFDFTQGSTFSPISSIRFGIGGGAPQGLMLLAWLDEVPPEVQVGGRRPSQQTTALLYTSLTFHLPAEGDVSLPPGLVPGTLVEVPVEGGPCGPNATSVYIGWGQAVFEFRMPEEVRDVQVQTLKLALGSDGEWGQPPDMAVYDWVAGEWLELDAPIMGVNVVSDAAGLIGDSGQVRVRLLSEDRRGGGCLYVELGLEGRR